MELIKQLGGYEKAKDGLHRLKLEKKDLLTCGDLVVVKSEIDAALIEYRRANNIFEAGDVAVSVDGEFYLHKIELGTSKEHCIKIFSHDMAHSCWVHDVNYRHATDAEIAAGHRL